MTIAKRLTKITAYGVGYLALPPITEAIRTKRKTDKVQWKNVGKACLL